MSKFMDEVPVSLNKPTMLEGRTGAVAPWLGGGALGIGALLQLGNPDLTAANAGPLLGPVVELLGSQVTMVLSGVITAVVPIARAVIQRIRDWRLSDLETQRMVRDLWNERKVS